MLSLEEKVEYLKEIVLSDCDMSRLALKLELKPSVVDSIYSIFDKYYSMCNKEDYSFNYINIEEDFRNIGIDYQALKSVILILGKNGQYLDVIKHYLETMGDKNSVPIEFHKLYDELCKSNETQV